MKSIKVLITAPLHQSPGIFREYQNALDALVIPDGVTVDRFFVVNNCHKLIPDIRGKYIEVNTPDRYDKDASGHNWTHENLWKMHGLRNRTIKAALEGGYDYWFSVVPHRIPR